HDYAPRSTVAVTATKCQMSFGLSGIPLDRISEGHVADGPREEHVGGVGVREPPLEGSRYEVIRAAAAVGNDLSGGSTHTLLRDPPGNDGAFGEVVVSNAQRTAVDQVDLEN